MICPTTGVFLSIAATAFVIASLSTTYWFQYTDDSNQGVIHGGLTEYCFSPSGNSGASGFCFLCALLSLCYLVSIATQFNCVGCVQMMARLRF